jgi:hypothetical protein
MQYASVSLSARTIKYSQRTAPTATIVVANTSYGSHIYVSDGTDACMAPISAWLIDGMHQQFSV